MSEAATAPSAPAETSALLEIEGLNAFYGKARALDDVVTPRADLTGVGSAAPILFAVFNRLGPSPWFRMPEADLKPVQVCKDDGYLPAGGCETRTQWAPLNSRFEGQSPYHRLVHLDARGRRVDGRCESPARMQHATWFVLPPRLEGAMGSDSL